MSAREVVMIALVLATAVAWLAIMRGVAP